MIMFKDHRRFTKLAACLTAVRVIEVAQITTFYQQECIVFYWFLSGEAEHHTVRSSRDTELV